MHVLLDKCYVFSFGNTTKVYSLSWQEAHEIEPNSVEQIKELLMLVTGGLTGRKKTCKWHIFSGSALTSSNMELVSNTAPLEEVTGKRQHNFGKLCLWRAINLTATWWVTYYKNLCWHFYRNNYNAKWFDKRMSRNCMSKNNSNNKRPIINVYYHLVCKQ